MTVLLVPPYVGEFGWELMNWQGRVRRLARLADSGGWPSFLAGCQRGEITTLSDVTEAAPLDSTQPPSRIVVLAKPDRERLYSGDGMEFRAIELPTLPGEVDEDGLVDSGRRLPPAEVKSLIARVLESNIKQLGIDDGAAWVYWPRFDGSLWSTAAGHQAFTSLRDAAAKAAGAELDVVLVPRLRKRAGDRNWSSVLWAALADRLEHRGLRVAVAGNNLEQSIGLFSRCRLAAGGSTGGLHLASLCECPHYVWGDGDQRRWTAWDISNRQRYETFWNALGTPVIYDAMGWRPEVDDVLDRICHALDRIGRGSERRWSRGRWAARRAIASLCTESGSRTLVPWRVRHWLKEACV